MTTERVVDELVNRMATNTALRHRLTREHGLIRAAVTALRVGTPLGVVLAQLDADGVGLEEGGHVAG